MKFLSLLLLILLNTFSLQAEEISGTIQYQSFEAAEKGTSRLQFIVESTKVGLFSSDVPGYVKDFTYKANIDRSNKIMREMKITIKTLSMDTDHGDRDKKLHNLCLSHDKYPVISVHVNGPLFLQGARNQKLSGTVNIRGKDKPFTIIFKVEEKEGRTLLLASSIWSLKEMEIPDPSIAVAKLSDDIRLYIRLDLGSL